MSEQEKSLLGIYDAAYLEARGADKFETDCVGAGVYAVASHVRAECAKELDDFINGLKRDLEIANKSGETWFKSSEEKTQVIIKHAARIAELEAERDGAKAFLVLCHAHLGIDAATARSIAAFLGPDWLKKGRDEASAIIARAALQNGGA
jgi:hypothetical protein